jgi:hypothetical protein
MTPPRELRQPQASLLLVLRSPGSILTPHPRNQPPVVPEVGFRNMIWELPKPMSETTTTITLPAVEPTV